MKNYHNRDNPLLLLKEDHINNSNRRILSNPHNNIKNHEKMLRDNSHNLNNKQSNHPRHLLKRNKTDVLNADGRGVLWKSTTADTVTPVEYTNETFFLIYSFVFR